MEKSHRKILLSKRLVLIDEINAEDITGYLYQYEVITNNNKDEIESLNTRREKIEFLLDLLPRRGPNAFKIFCRVLHEVKCYSHLADMLEAAVNKRKSKGDCVDGRRSSFDVIKSINIRPRSSSRLQPDMLNSYEMNSKTHGWCLILNNYDFYSLSNRTGSHVDATNLQNLFRELGFRIWTLNNLTANEIRDRFIELSNKNDHTDCLVVCILSHGVAGKIYGIDGDLISVGELLHILNSGPIAELLLNKPKLFLIQACRVDEEKPQSFETTTKIIESSEVVIENHLSKDEKVLETFVDQTSKDLQKHLLLGYSTFPGEVAWRNTAHGSYYIDSVVDVFQTYASSEDVLSMLVKVNDVVGQKLLEHGVHQTPSPVFTTTKKLYLLPV